jgi:predicted nucleic acid-binding protein
VIAYLDTSVVVPLLIAEPTSEACQRLWEDADSVVSSRLAFVEAAAALARARRLDRLTSRVHSRSLAALEELWSQIDALEITDALMRAAAEVARAFGLRGYDAVHCASALALADRALVAASGDRRLLTAWRDSGLATFDPQEGLSAG